MKKTFPLQAPGKEDARVRDKIRHEVNKYLRRSRRKPPQEGYRGWEFACRLGESEASAVTLPLGEVGGGIDRVAATGAKQVYVELIAMPARRVPPPESVG